jgi:hypothetical protein
VPEPLSLLTTAYGDLAAVLSSLTVEEGWQPTGCAGWTPVDLGFHLLSDARRALVALNTPAPGPVDTDAVSYWTAWRPPAPGDEEELWSTRIAASVHGGLRGIAGRYTETTAAVLVAAGRVDLDDPVGTQGRVLTGSDLLSTLTVEAAVRAATGTPRPGRRAAGRGAPGAGRAARPAASGELGRRHRRPARHRPGAADPSDRTELGDAVDAFPLFG